MSSWEFEFERNIWKDFIEGDNTKINNAVQNLNSSSVKNEFWVNLKMTYPIKEGWRKVYKENHNSWHLIGLSKSRKIREKSVPVPDAPVPVAPVPVAPVPVAPVPVPVPVAPVPVPVPVAPESKKRARDSSADYYDSESVSSPHVASLNNISKNLITIKDIEKKQNASSLIAQRGKPSIQLIEKNLEEKKFVPNDASIYEKIYEIIKQQQQQRNNIKLLEDVVFIMTGVRTYFSKEELSEIIHKCGGVVKPNHTASDFRSNNLCILVRGYEEVDVENFLQNPVKSHYPGLINSNKVFSFIQEIEARKQQEERKHERENVFVVDDYTLLRFICTAKQNPSDWKDFLSLEMKQRLEHTKPLNKEYLFSSEQRKVMDWLLTIHGVGDMKALRCFSEEPFLFKDETKMIEIFGNNGNKVNKQTQLEKFFTKIKFEKKRNEKNKKFVLNNIKTDLIDFAKKTLLNGMIRFPAKYIRNVISLLEIHDAENGDTLGAKVLGSYFRNIHHDENFLCGDIDVLIPLNQAQDDKNIEKKKSERIDKYITAMKQKFEEHGGFQADDIKEIDEGNKFRKLIVPLQKDDKSIFHVRMDVKCGCVGPEYESMKLHQIGSSEFNTFCSKKALQKGLRLSQLGLVDVSNQVNIQQKITTCSGVSVINVTNQEELFSHLGIPYGLFGSDNDPIKYVNRNKKQDYESIIMKHMKQNYRCELAIKLINFQIN